MRQASWAAAALAVALFSAPEPRGALDVSSEPAAVGRVVQDGALVALEVSILGLASRPLDVALVGDSIRLRFDGEAAPTREGGTVLDGVRRVERDGDRVRVAF